MDRIQLQERAAETLRHVAETIQLKGVGAVLIVKDGETVWNPTLVVVGRFVREADPARGPDDHGSNYAAVAWAKMAEMLSTGTDSGTLPERQVKKGENGYRGGVTIRIGEYRLLVCFSGGTPDEDVLVSRTVMETLQSAFQEERKQ